MNPRQLGQYADEAGDAVRQTIRAYHGSPHDFDRFDASKIGTGEGAQTFGYGHYLAGNEETAKHYRDNLSPKVVEIADGQNVPIPMWLAGDLLGNKDAMRGIRDQLRSDKRFDASDVVKKEVAVMDAILSGAAVRRDGGRLYEVEVGHPEEKFIDYDSSLSQQTPYVRERLARLDYWSPSIMRMAREEGMGRSVVDAFRHSFTNSPEVGSKILTDAGLPGIRYLDQMSRAQGAGTRNYVVFPGAEDQIRILRKYAVPGAVGTGVASQYGEE